MPNKRIDWAAVFMYLNKEMSVAKIANETGISRSYIDAVKHERREVSEDNDKFVKAMLLFLDRTDRDIPVIGQHFPELIRETGD